MNIPITQEQVEVIANPRLSPSIAQKKIQGWIRSRHLICLGNFLIYETLDYGAIDRFSDCVTALGGTLISVHTVGRVWIGDHRQVILYRAKASLYTHLPHQALKQYWTKYGGPNTRFDERLEN